MNISIMSKRTFQPRAFLFFVLLTVTTLLLGGLVGGLSGFDQLIKPPFTPAAAVFPFAWTILSVMTGFAAYLVWNTNDIESRRILRLYLMQLLLHALWPLFFFRLEWRLFSFFWLLLPIALVSMVMTGFRYIRQSSYWLTLPYFLWLVFAAYWNLGIGLLNR